MRAVPVLIVAVCASAADQLTLVLPQTVHQPVGATTALRGGAAYALGSEAAATWYNPAMAASIDAEQLSAGATAYGFNRIQVTAGRESDALLSGAVLKVYAGLSARSADGRFGLTAMLCNPVHWSGAVDSGRTLPNATERSYASHVRVDQDTWSVQLAGGWRPSDDLQFGVAVVGNYDTVDLNQSGWTRDINGRYTATSFTAAAWGTSVQGKLGVRGSPVEHLSLGLSLVTPGVPVLSGGLVESSSAQSDPVANTAASASARVDDDPFSFVHAWQVGLGAGWAEPAWEAELDLVWSLPNGTHETVPPLPGYRTSTVAGVTTLESILEPARVTNYRHVLNLRVGGGYNLNERITLHAGAFTDLSPIGDSQLYNTIDFLGATGGIMIKRGDTGIILGTSATWGQEPVTVFNPATNTNQDGEIAVFAMDVLLGTVSKF